MTIQTAKHAFVDFAYTPEPEFEWDPPKNTPMLYYTPLTGRKVVRSRPNPEEGFFALRPRKLRLEEEYLWSDGVLALLWPLGKAGGGFALEVTTEEQLEVIRGRYLEHQGPLKG